MVCVCYILKQHDTPLHVAKNKEVAEILIQNGAKVNSRDSKNQTPLHVAKNKEVAEILHQNGANIHSRNNNGDSVLHLAASQSDHSAVKLLISLGANVSARNKENQTPLDVAKSIDVAEMLIQNGADINSADSKGDSALHLAAIQSDDSAVKFLIKLGANVSARNNEGRTPLESLEETYKKSDGYIGKTQGDSALHLAVSQSDHRAVKVLIRLGANVSARNKEVSRTKLYL
ncbi:unnamed protein product [Mytilus coruscus]|uniref:Uncharacterized protein n=1 Tax=Mytilus coruscus TaxID=42192 RepID=A0A6J8DWR5_MYTCO|nr:unnamed protein product [Mytilus coruscus]